MSYELDQQDLAIGVFDSGVGGLTVLNALQQHLPNERFIYLGDTARLPYGTKGNSTIARYTLQIAEHLFSYGIKMLVIACNTASTYGLEPLKALHPHFPIMGVIEPGAKKACELSSSGHILVLATEATVRGKSYHQAILKQRPSAQVYSEACSLFIALVEEGLSTGEIAEATAKHYLKQYLQNDTFSIDCLLLGCTHFPVLKKLLAELLGDGVAIVDSAETTAFAVQRQLQENGLLRLSRNGSENLATFLVTDAPERFALVASRILGYPIRPEQVELVDLV